MQRVHHSFIDPWRNGERVSDDRPDEVWLQRIGHVLRPEQYQMQPDDAAHCYLDVAQGFGRHYVAVETANAKAELLVERLRGIFPEDALRSIMPSWAKGDPFERLALDLRRNGIGLVA